MDGTKPLVGDPTNLKDPTENITAMALELEVLRVGLLSSDDASADPTPVSSPLLLGGISIIFSAAVTHMEAMRLVHQSAVPW